MPSSVCGPDDRDVGDRAVGDPHLGAVQDPVVAVASRARAHRAGVGAGVRLGQAEAADRLAGRHPSAATPASAPRSPSGGSRTSRASPAPRRSCARRCRRPRAPGRPGRRRSRSCRRSRSPRGACRAGRAGRSRARARDGIVPSSNHSATFGLTRSSTNARTVSRIRRSSSSSRWSMSRKSLGADRLASAAASSLGFPSRVHCLESSAVSAPCARRAASSGREPQNASGVEKISMST